MYFSKKKHWFESVVIPLYFIFLLSTDHILVFVLIVACAFLWVYVSVFYVTIYFSPSNVLCFVIDILFNMKIYVQCFNPFVLIFCFFVNLPGMDQICNGIIYCHSGSQTLDIFIVICLLIFPFQFISYIIFIFVFQ